MLSGVWINETALLCCPDGPLRNRLLQSKEAPLLGVHIPSGNTGLLRKKGFLFVTSQQGVTPCLQICVHAGGSGVNYMGLGEKSAVDTLEFSVWLVGPAAGPWGGGCEEVSALRVLVPVGSSFSAGLQFLVLEWASWGEVHFGSRCHR